MKVVHNRPSVHLQCEIENNVKEIAGELTKIPPQNLLFGYFFSSMRAGKSENHKKRGEFYEKVSDFKSSIKKKLSISI